jgi:hypothetical protein
LTPPYKAWRLPESDDLGFYVLKTPRIHGDCGYHEGRIFIRLSVALVGCTQNLIATMAHEMIHAEQWRRKDKSPSGHNAFFNHAADRACAWHGFDRKTF